MRLDGLMWMGCVVAAAGLVFAAPAGAQPVGPALQLLAPDGAEDDEFGWEVATTGQYMAVGASVDDDDGPSTGSVYVYKLNTSGVWEFQTKLLQTDTTINHFFGSSVAMTPGAGPGLGILAVGQPADGQFGNHSGAVFIHTESSFSSNPWSFQKKVVAVDPGLNKSFGTSVALDNNVLLVGSPGDHTVSLGGGSAHIHYRAQGGPNNWGSVKKLAPPDPAGGQTCGEHVALDGDVAVVSARGDSTMGSETGAAYVYLQNQGGADNWGFAKKLLAPDGEANDQFGYAVAVSGDIVAVGSRGDDDVASRAGATYIFDRNAGGPDNFGFVKKLLPPDAGADAFVGSAVALHGDILATGGPSAHNGTPPFSGSFYVHGRDVGGADNWGLLHKVVAPDAMNSDQFAQDLDVRDGVIISGARLDDTTAAPDSGSAWVFTVDSLCPEDLNGDGVVDTADLGLLIGAFGGSGLGDINLDGAIDTADLGLLLGATGDDCTFTP